MGLLAFRRAKVRSDMTCHLCLGFPRGDPRCSTIPTRGPNLQQPAHDRENLSHGGRWDRVPEHQEAVCGTAGHKLSEWIKLCIIHTILCIVPTAIVTFNMTHIMIRYPRK